MNMNESRAGAAPPLWHKCQHRPFVSCNSETSKVQESADANAFEKKNCLLNV